MDQTRQIRFLIPPFILYGSLLWGLYCSDQCHNRWWSLMHSSETILAFVSIAGVSALPLGFLIGTISVMVLRLFFLPTRHKYETCVSVKCLGQMNRKVSRQWESLYFKDLSIWKKKREEHMIEVTFSHGVLKEKYPGVHEWLVRRWNAFNLSAHCVCALALAHVAGPVLGWGWPPPCRWWLPSLVLGIALFFTSFFAWRETMAMIEFQSDTYS
jgi:hypothetical protein